MSSWLGLRHVALNVADVAKSLDFYRKVLGMELEWQPDSNNAYLTSGQDNLALHGVDQGNGEESSTQNLDHFGFLVSQPQEVDAWAERVRSFGIPLERNPQTHRDGARSFYFRDPDHNLIQILYHPPISGKP